MNNVQRILNKIKSINKDRILIAIDGRSASGKSNLSRYLEEELDASVVSMDDFFLRKELRTKERYEEIGGNVEYLRVKEEVILPFINKEDIKYRPYDCKKFEFGEIKNIKENNILIIEGSYSLHPTLIDYYDFKIFLDVNTDEQINRLMKRNPNNIEIFINEWIVLEERYFIGLNTKDKADLYIDTSEENIC